MGGELAGLLTIDKPEGPTSHDVADIVRRVTAVRRVGHTGTLDPFASGLLLLCVGWTTRLAEYLTALPKAYRGIIRLGERTDTDDRTGRVVARSDAWRGLDAERVRRALESQTGEIEQRPPAYSAKKVAGRRAYALARGGEAPELKAERVTVHRLSLCEMSLPDVGFEIECSSGTYVRSVARDLGEALGVGAHLRWLRRVRIGAFVVEDALRLDREASREDVVAGLRPPEAAVSHLPRADLDAENWDAIRHGRPVSWEEASVLGPVAVFMEGKLVAMAELKGDLLRPKKVFMAMERR